MTEAICRIQDCTDGVLCRRLCPRHYGRLNAGIKRIYRPSLTERIWSRVQRGHVDECWPWYGHRTPKGYGKINVGAGVRVPQLVTRVVFQATHGYLPPVVRHACDNPPCVNPAHLLPGTVAENNADMAGRRRAAHGESHPHTRLTAEQVQTIRSAPGPQRRIAEAFGISQQQVSDIKRRRSWRHL